MRELKRNRNKKHVTIVMGTALVLLFVMTVGYAAFATNISINAKGNLKKIQAADMLKKKVVTSGDGLYADATEQGRYIYRGGNPHNYITFNNETWRIVSVEGDGTIKIIMDDVLASMPFDSSSNQANRTSTTSYDASTTEYCGHAYATGTYYGCNVWGSNQTTTDVNGTLVSSMIFDDGRGLHSNQSLANKSFYLPSEEASLNTYLNTTYYNGFNGETKSFITNHNYNVGLVGLDNATLAADVNQEKQKNWNGHIGLMSITDYVKASTNSSCTGVKTYVFAGWGRGGVEACYNSKGQYNWLYSDTIQWIMQPFPDNVSHNAWGIDNAGYMFGVWSYLDASVRPVLYLKSSITLLGQGTSQNPYTID